MSGFKDPSALTKKSFRSVPLKRIYLKARYFSLIFNLLQVISVILIAFLLHFRRDFDDSVLNLLVYTASFVIVSGGLFDIKNILHGLEESERLQTLNESLHGVEEMNLSLRKQRHDFLNHLQVVCSLIDLNEYQEASAYINKVYGDIRELSEYMRTNQPAINALLRIKLSPANQKGILTLCTIKSDWNSLPLPGWELCGVLSNLIDNAIEALEGQGSSPNPPRLEVILGETLQAYFFEIRNNGPAIPKEKQSLIFNAGYSHKGEDRGMGLYIAKETLSRCGGKLEVHSDEELTVFRGVFPKAASTPLSLNPNPADAFVNAKENQNV